MPFSCLRFVLVLLLVMLAASSSIGQVGGRSELPGGWAAIAVDDLHFIRATLRTNHPGPADDQNPWFGEWFEAGFREAIELAERAQDFAGYYYAIKHYMVGFQDGHLGALGEIGELDERLRYRWPRFMLGYEDGTFQVRAVSAGSPVQQADRLLSCDGQPADDLAERLVGDFYDLWSVEGARVFVAPFLLIDAGNPFSERPTSCRFEKAGEVRLEWVLISRSLLEEKLAQVREPIRPPIEIQKFAPKSYWITLSSFNANDEKTVAAIREVVGQIEEDPLRFRNSELIVFDVRGNGGGSSMEGRMVANALWGENFIDAVTPRAEAVDWRASAGNARFMMDSMVPRMVRNFGEDDPATQEFREFAEALTAAAERGEIYYREAVERVEDSVPPNPVSAKIFFLTDSWCFSACLNFADSLLAIEGTTHIGRSTRADAIYIDNRGVWLPSHLGRLGFSMKVYRGRPRGHNQAYQPVHSWTGSIADTAALQAWVLDLVAPQGE